LQSCCLHTLYGKFYNIIPKIRELFNPQNNAEMLSLLLKGEIHKTVPAVYSTLASFAITTTFAILLSSHALNKHGRPLPLAGTNVKLNNSFAGTFIHWELNFNNVNINYE